MLKGHLGWGDVTIALMASSAQWEEEIGLGKKKVVVYPFRVGKMPHRRGTG